jgi:hypothetical protein
VTDIVLVDLAAQNLTLEANLRCRGRSGCRACLRVSLPGGFGRLSETYSQGKTAK